MTPKRLHDELLYRKHSVLRKQESNWYVRQSKNSQSGRQLPPQTPPINPLIWIYVHRTPTNFSFEWRSRANSLRVNQRRDYVSPVGASMYCSPQPAALHIAPAARLRGFCL